MTLAALPRLHYRPGQRGERRPITADHLARCREYRELGLPWSTCASLLRVNKNRLVAAMEART